jgi:hypothetical protein
LIRSQEFDVAKKKASRRQEPPQAKLTITQQKRDRVACILAVMVGLLAVREGGAVLFGVSAPGEQVLPWLAWYGAAMGILSVIAGIGIWMQAEWSVSLGVNIVVFNAIVCAGLIGLDRFVQPVAAAGIFGTMFRTVTWVVIVFLLRWKRQPQAGEVSAPPGKRHDAE